MPGLIGIGVGPGGVELLTVKAVKAIQNADIIMCPASKEDRPSIAFSVVSSIIDKSKNQEIMKTIHVKKEIMINAPADEILPLACPVLEYDWIPGWKCKLLYCPNGKNEKVGVVKENMTSSFTQNNVGKNKIIIALNIELKKIKVLKNKHSSKKIGEQYQWVLYFCSMAKKEDKFKRVISHAKEYGYVFQSSEIYDGLMSVYDY